MTLRREMIGSTATEVKTEWAWPSSPPSHRNPREEKSSHSYNIRPFQRIAQSPSPAVPTETHHPQPIHSPPINLNFFHFPSQFPGQPGIEPDMDQNDHVQGWMPHFPNPAQTPFMNHEHGQPHQHGLSIQLPENGFGLSWDVPGMAPVAATTMGPENQDAYMSDPLDRGSFSSVAFSTSNTAASSMSDGWVFPVSSPSYGSPGTKEMLDLNRPDDHVNQSHPYDNPFLPFGKPSSPISSDEFSFEGDGVTNIDWNMIDPFGAETVHWSPANHTPQAQTHQTMSQDPYAQLSWNSPDPRVDAFSNVNCLTYDPPPTTPHHMYRAQEEVFEEPSRIKHQIKSKPVRTHREKEVEWEDVRKPSYALSYSSQSQSPPVSQNTPSQTSSPSQNSSSPPSHNEIHSHIFSAFPGPPKRKPQRGRVRPLTVQEKRNAREVRLAGACWACHLSKIRCSPCSPGAPCEQCTRLTGKRRFCRLPCFNDPLEALSTFLVPDYLMGHFTRANVEAFVTRNASSWGTESFVVQMTWGFQRPLKASVVTLAISNGPSEIGYRYRAKMRGDRSLKITQHESPPIGIPLAAMIEMETEYASYVKDIVMNDLDYYCEMAYADEESYIPELLLKAICDFYTAGLHADEECDLLRQAIEIHVTCTILERSLILDNESIRNVENNLGRKYPARSAPRCAQRQIKLALFNVQRQRIISVLAKWGSMMWTSNTGTSNERKWAVGFSVFLVLTLIIDKTLGAAYKFCENRIENLGFEAKAERARCNELGRLTETELFERCKEIMHSRFKTRKAGKESCNPVRDGNGAWRGKAVDGKTERLVQDLQAVVSEFNEEVRAHRSVLPDESEIVYEESPYRDAGRLACILLDDFLDHRE